MGDAVKNFYFNNCRFNAIRGSSIVTEWNTKAGQAIHIINNDTLLHTSNYKTDYIRKRLPVQNRNILFTVCETK